MTRQRNLLGLTLAVAALLLLPAMAAAKIKPGTYKGKLPDGGPVKMVIANDGSHVKLTYTMSLQCQSSPTQKLSLTLSNKGQLGSDGSANGGDETQDVGAFGFGLERALNGFDLAADASYTGNELGFFADRVGHGFPRFDTIPPYI